MDNLPILVLENLFSKLTLADLLHIRLVNSKFLDLATPMLSKAKLFKVSLRTTAHLTKYLSVHNNSLNTIPFTEFTLNPNIGTDSQFLEFCQLYAKSVTHLYVNLLPDDPSYHIEKNRVLNFKGVYSGLYDTRVLERISLFLQYANNIQVLILEPDRDGYEFWHSHIETDVGKVFKDRESERPPICPEVKVPILSNLSVFYCGATYLWKIHWTEEILRNAPEIKYIARRLSIGQRLNEVVYLKPGAESDSGAVTQHLQGNMIYTTPDGMQMAYDDWRWSCISSKHLKDIELICITSHEQMNIQQVFVSITSGPSLNSYVFPKVTAIQLWCNYLIDETVLQLRPSSFPALRYVRTMETPVFLGILNPFGDHVYETVEEFEFLCGGDPCSWHTIFPNVRRLGAAMFGPQPVNSLSYLLPRFHKIEALCIVMYGDERDDSMSKFYAGGDPNVLSFKKLKKLEYKKLVHPQILKELVKSSSLGYINNVIEISISIFGSISDKIGKEQTLDYLQTLNFRHEFVELIETTAARMQIQFYP